jgi:type IV secretion system protein VirB10
MSSNTSSPDASSALGSNPYFAQQVESPSQATLDAGAPSLPTSDSQRLNKRILVFLGGLVGLLAIAGFMLVRGGSKHDSPAAEPRQERVEVPTAPVAPSLPVTAAPANTQTAPIALAPPPSLPPMPAPPELYDPPVTQGPTLAERRILAEAPSPQPSLMALDAMRAQQPVLSSLEPTKATSATFLNQPGALLLRGTYLRCALETRIITDVNGFTSCVVTEPVYSVNGGRLLLPKGSKVFGQYGSGAIRGERVAVIWDRIVTPTGIDVTMASPGIDNLGSAGHPGDYTAHWGQRIGSALFISLLSDAFKYYGEKEGPTTTTTYPGAGAVVQQPFQSNTARTVERLANQAVQAGGNRPPTVTVNQGAIVNIYVSQDVDFSGVLRN